MSKRRLIPADAENVTVRPYVPGNPCWCCGDPDCRDFEERMAAWGIPLDEITEVGFTTALPPRRH